MSDLISVDKKSKTVRTRSFPYYSIKECVSFIQALNKSEGTREVHIESAYKRMGLNPSSSNSARALSALSSYGLIEERGAGDSKFIKISPIGKQILYSEGGSDEWLEYVRKAALNDPVTKLIYEKYKDGLPSKETLERYLILEVKFTERAAVRFSGVVMDTFLYARLAEMDSQDFQFEEDGDDPSLKSNRTSQPGANKPGLSSVGTQNPPLHDEKSKLEEYRIPLVGGSAFIALPVPISKKNLNLITKWLSLMEEALTLTDNTEGEIN